MNVTLRQLNVFASVAKHLSFTRAAEELCLTQPAVSMQVKQLENQLDAPLFEHLGKRIYLTEAGKEVYHYSRLISHQLEELENVLATQKGLEKGRLKLAVALTANYLTPSLVGTFAHRHPGIKVSLDVNNREALIADLAENEVDLAIMGEPPEDMDLQCAAFLENPLIIVAAPNHPLAERRTIPLKQLEQEVFLVREAGSGTRKALERYFAEHGVHLNTGMEVASNEAIKQSVQAGLGLGLLSAGTVELELALNRLVVLDVVGLPIIQHWYVVHRKGKRLSSAARTFREFLLAEAPKLMHQQTRQPAASA